MYNKLFTKILDSSIWLETHTTRLVFITLLAAMDEDGYAHFSAVENLASRARVTVTQCNAAIKTLSEPDPNSCDPEFEGRRIERVPGGFVILNAKKYRDIANNASNRASTRLRVQRHREKKAAGQKAIACNTDVTVCALQNVTSPSPSASENASDIKGGVGESGYPPEAVIPTVDEIFAACPLGAGIPRDYCKHYHEESTIRNRWVKGGQLIQWRIDIVKWWTKDRSEWGKRKKNSQPEANQIDEKIEVKLL